MRIIKCDRCGVKIYKTSTHWNHFRYEDFNRDFCPGCSYKLMKLAVSLEMENFKKNLLEKEKRERYNK